MTELNGMTKMDRWQAHVNKWKDCRRCPLWEKRHKVVLARGKIPCDVLFVGEAPGDSEDLIGQPFVGPAGHLLNDIIKAASRSPLRMAFTNVVACFPAEAKKTEDHRPPSLAIKKCFPRLKEFVELAEPQLIVLVGEVAKDSFGHPEGRYSSIQHPAAILHSNKAAQGLMIKRCVLTLAKYFQELERCRK